MWSEYFMSKPKAKSKTKAKTKAKTETRSKVRSTTAPPPPRQLREVADWRKQTLARMRALILEADPAMVEERKWVKKTNPAGVPVFSHDGIVCTGETYKKVVKLTFAHGASLPDPAKLFNAGLDGNVRRAIDIPEGATVDATAFKTLVKAAVARNTGKS
jgi:hypothetical protein